MADLGFPSNPSPGQVVTIGSKTYQWTGYAWVILSVDTGVVSQLTVTNLVITTTTNAVSTQSGALIVAGGVGIGGDLWVQGEFYLNGSVILTTSTFNGTLNGGDDILITDIGGGTLRWDNTSTLQTVTGRGFTTTNRINITNTTESTSTNTGALTVSGGIGVAKRVTCESIRIADAVLDSTRTTVNTTASTVIDTFSLTEFRSAKYLIQIDEGIGGAADFELIEILLVADNAGNVYPTEYGVVTSNGDLGTFDAEVVGDTVNLYFTAYTVTAKTLKVLRTGIAA